MYQKYKEGSSGFYFEVDKQCAHMKVHVRTWEMKRNMKLNEIWMEKTKSGSRHEPDVELKSRKKKEARDQF